jgi:Met-zincin/Domain of unknown function (DUF5117)
LIRLRSLVIVFLALASSVGVVADTHDDEKPLPTIADKTKPFKKLDGYFPLYWDERKGKLWLEISLWNSEFLFLDSLPAGVGSNDIGLDRGQLGDGRVVKFDRVGPRVLLKEINLSYRSSSDNPAEKRSVQDAFAQSVLWGFEVAAETNGRVLVDATAFFMSDAHRVAETLKATKQGPYKIDDSRSAIYLENTRNFPQNTEVESTLTFTFSGDELGKWVTQVVPDPTAITVREHYSFVKLPDNHYRPRVYDPRSSYISFSYSDYSAPIGQPLEQRLIIRHRLEKKDPAAAVSDPAQPIVYYLDPGTPEPIRSALLEGAGWWNQAFEAAGFRNAFRVEMLPPDADPMDVRYNDIEWVHRATRGWSYGSAIVDPRTGEIIKGHVILGSLRARQDYLIFEGLLAPYKQGQATDPRLKLMVLARLRQLAAHEVGHTLGLRHNYVASTENRASVMDYPAPLISLEADGSFNTSEAYATGIGEWDKVSIQWGYSQFPPNTEQTAALNQIIDNARKRGLTYLTDQDARPSGSASPVAHLWDNGKNAVDELNRVMKVRAQALERFGEDNIPPGTPMAMLEDTLVPVYLFHRYQVEAATKEIGGLEYSYALRGDGQVPTAPIPPEEQRRALNAILATISPEALVIPDRIQKLIPPHPAGYERTRESFATHTGMTFDPIGAAQTAAQVTLTILLNPERAARLLQATAQDPQQLGLSEMLDRLWTATWKSQPHDANGAAMQRAVDDVALSGVMELASNAGASPEVRAMTLAKLEELRVWAATEAAQGKAEETKAHLQFAVAQIRKFEVDPAQVLKPSEPLETPPGSPIGSTDKHAYYEFDRE